MSGSKPPVDVLVISAHPDDAEFGMGGTLARLADEGRSIAQVVLTAGDAGTYGDVDTRKAEQRAACDVLGSVCDVLDFPDCGLYVTPQLVDAIVEKIRRWRPRIVFAPYHNQPESHRYGSSHPDHENAGKAAKAACRFARFRNYRPDIGEPHKVSRIYFYIVPPTMRPTFIVDFSANTERWRKLLAAHESQTKNLRDGRLLDHLVLLKRTVGIHATSDYAESFIVDEPLKLETDALFEKPPEKKEEKDKSQFTPF